MQRGLETGPSGVQWVVSGYALTFGLALVPAGRLGDAFGRRRMFLVALASFVLCSAAVGAAPTIELLIVARLLQGLAAGMLAPQNSGLIQNLFSGAERARAFGMFGTVVGLSTASGPLVGGLILGAAGGPDGWRWIFFVNLPIGLVALVLAARLIPPVPGSGLAHRDIDWVGAGLLGGAVLAVLLPLAQAESGGHRAALVAVRRERRARRTVRPLGAAGGAVRAPSRCSTSGCCPRLPATAGARRWERCTSSVSPASGSSPPSSSRAVSATRRCSPAWRRCRSRSARPWRPPWAGGWWSATAAPHRVRAPGGHRRVLDGRAAVRRRRPVGGGDRRRPCPPRGGHGRWVRPVAEPDDDTARGAGADGRLGGRRAADRATRRRGDRDRQGWPGSTTRSSPRPVATRRPPSRSRSSPPSVRRSSPS